MQMWPGAGVEVHAVAGPTEGQQHVLWLPDGDLEISGTMPLHARAACIADIHGAPRWHQP